MSETTARHDDLPPLKIVHFMLWTAVVAVAFAVSNVRALQGMNYGGANIALTSFGLLLSTLPATVCFIGMSWRRRGLPFPTSPGHFIVVWGAAYYAQYVAQITLFVNSGVRDLSFPNWTLHGSLSALVSLLGWLWVFFIVVVACRVFWLRRSWRNFCLARAIVHVFEGFVLLAGNYIWQSFLFGVSQSQLFIASWVLVQLLVSAIICLIALLLAVADDSSLRIRRDWSHWAGVSFSTLGSVYSIAVTIYYLVNL